ncbi:hypothetical protein GB937_008749 [Aspergillus fischeri]|nr:hypothetical protein GB937_008749 [Aspergillus fischeri]
MFCLPGFDLDSRAAIAGGHLSVFSAFLLQAPFQLEYNQNAVVYLPARDIGGSSRSSATAHPQIKNSECSRLPHKKVQNERLTSNFLPVVT